MRRSLINFRLLFFIIKYDIYGKIDMLIRAFTNDVLNQIVEKCPENQDELITIKGLEKVKIDKYGRDILEIVKKYNTV
ncbi:hypothetical protein DVW02_09150 [Clostridium botulinum]|nr:hypothetical protein [Clostridium botulinum]